MGQDDSTAAAPARAETAPSIPSEPLIQLQQKKVFIAFILLAVIIVAITIAAILFTNFQLQKTSESTNHASQTLPVDLKVEYQNPFDKNAQYENPFENLK